MTGMWDMTMAAAVLPAIARAAGLIVASPIPAGTAVPMKLRYALAVGIALAAITRTPSFVAAPMGGGDLLVAVACDFALGLVIGFAARVVFVGVELAASQAAHQMGLSLGEAFGGGVGVGGSPVRRLMGLLAVVILLSAGAHRVLISAVLRTFEAIPRGLGWSLPAVLESTVALLAVSFQLGLKLAAPVLAAMLLATVALGMLQRAVPQCTILSVGLPVRAWTGLAMLAVALTAVAGLLDVAVEQLAQGLTGLIETLGRGQA